MFWNESGITFLIDDEEIGSLPAQDGYWQQTGFKGENPWANGTATAPFDQQVSKMSLLNFKQIICEIILVNFVSSVLSLDKSGDWRN